VYEDELVRVAVERLLSHDIGRLPIVDREDPSRLVGYLGRSGIVAARQRLHDDKHVRERGVRSVTS
jgi:CIC family chloride channel protein